MRWAIVVVSSSSTSRVRRGSAALRQTFASRKLGATSTGHCVRTLGPPTPLKPFVIGGIRHVGRCLPSGSRPSGGRQCVPPRVHQSKSSTRAAPASNALRLVKRNQRHVVRLHQCRSATPAPPAVSSRPRPRSGICALECSSISCRCVHPAGRDRSWQRSSRVPCWPPSIAARMLRVLIGLVKYNTERWPRQPDVPLQP